MKMVLSLDDLREAVAFWLTATRMRTPVIVTDLQITEARKRGGRLVASYSVTAEVEPKPLAAGEHIVQIPPWSINNPLPPLSPIDVSQLAPDDPRRIEAEKIKERWGTNGKDGPLPTQEPD